MKRAIVSLVCGVALCVVILPTEVLAAKRGQKLRIKEDVKNGSKRGNARTVTMVSTGKRLGAASSEGETP